MNHTILTNILALIAPRAVVRLYDIDVHASDKERGGNVRFIKEKIP